MTLVREPSGQWRLERRIDLGTILAVASALAVSVALVSGLSARMLEAEDKLCRVERRVEDSQGTAIKLERVEERLAGVQAALQEIRDELKARRSAP